MSIRVDLPRSGIVITLRCNLKCKLCGGYIPYYNNPPHWDLEFVSRVIDKYFEIVDTVGDFDISGGETFLHEQLAEIVYKALEYEERFSRLLILTNGTIIPSDKVIKAMTASKKVLVTISDYKKSTKTEELIRVLKKNKIAFRVIDYTDVLFCDGWVNYDSSTRLLYTEEELIRRGKSCAVRNRGCNFLVQNGQIHSCGRSYRRMEIGMIPYNKEEYVDLFDETISVEEKRKTLLDLFHSSYGTSCAFCYGLCKTSERFQPAEQLTPEELDCIQKGARYYTEVCEMMEAKKSK